MKIRVNDQEFTVPQDQQERILAQFERIGMEQNEKLGLEFQLVATTVARTALSHWENKVRKSHGKEAALAMRPPKKVEPVAHLSRMILGIFGEAIKDAEVSITTDEFGQTTSLSLSLPTKGGSWGQMVPDGHLGEREDHRSEVS